MPEVFVNKPVKKVKKTNGKSERSEMEVINQIAGAKPELPADLPRIEWSQQAQRVLSERYFLKDENGDVIEDTPQMCWRVAWEIAKAEAKYGKTREEIISWAKSYYKLIAAREFIPNSPTLMNAGKGNGLQYSACYVLPVPDSLEGIFDGLKYQSLIHQSGGGTGFSFSRLRRSGARVKSSMGVASGPVSFMKIYNEATQQIKQGGMRRGANMGILRVDHPDIMSFIHCKENGGMTNFNISVAITDKFMQALSEDKEYELVDPHNNELIGSLSAADVWNEIAQTAWKSGDPGIVFIDRINAGSANPIRRAGWEIESTNPCVTGDTLVSTQDGLVRIKNLYQSKDAKINLLLDNRLTGVKWGQAQAILQTGVKEVFKLKTKEGYEIKLTLNHRLRTRQGWREVKDLRFGDKLLITNQKGAFGKRGNLNLGQVLGWLVGDGTMKATEAVLSFFGREKRELAPKFATMVNQLTTGMQKLNREYSVGVGWLADRDEARVGSVRLWRLAEGYGIKPGHKLIVPEDVFLGTEEMQRGFLQALFTADGHVSGFPGKGVSVRLTSISLDLLIDVQRLLLNFGIASSIYKNRRKPQERMLPDGKGGSKNYWCKTYHDLVISKDSLWQFAREIAFLVEYKNMALVDRLRQYKEGPYRSVFEATFESLELQGKEVVYDLVEPISHSFIANGFVAHNCGEQPLYPFDACNLGSIFLKYFIRQTESGAKEIDWENLKKTIHVAVRFLDSVIDVNPFPLPQIADMVRQIRRIGLGVGGWADMLVGLGIPYDSQEALDLAEKLMKFVNDEGHKASIELAAERGPFPMWEESIYKDSEPIRNSTVTTIAPTGSIGILADNSGGIEPLFAVAFQHVVKSENRTLNFVNPAFENLARERGFYTDELMQKVVEQGSLSTIEEIPDDVKKIFRTAHEIAPEWHVKMQAAFQKWTDNAVSKTINLEHNATPEDVKNAYFLAWQTGCSGITVFRDGCLNEQVLNAGVKADQKPAEDVHIPWERPTALTGSTYKIKTPVGNAFITVNQDELGNPIELFINIGKAGSDVQAMAEALGRVISKAFKFNGNLNPRERAGVIAEQMQGIGGGRAIGFGPNRVKSLPDAVARAIYMHFGFPSEQPENKPHKDICPKCGDATLVLEEGCKKCYSCGHSEC